MFGNGNCLVTVNRNNFQHRNFRHAAHFVKSAARGHVDQPFIGHVLQQRLKRNFLIAAQTKLTCNLALARRLLRRLDKFQYLIAGGEPLKLRVFGHVLIGPPYQYPLYRGRACKEASAVRRHRVYRAVAHGQL